MIRPEELRIGNYVKYNTMILSVIGINHPVPCEDKRYRDKWVIDLLCDGIITATIDDLEPVAITEDWIISLGFYNLRYERWGFTKAPTDYILEKQDNWFFIGIKPDNTTVYFSWDIYHVHQLQNIILALTGTELIKTP